LVTTTFSGRQAVVGVDINALVAYTDADQVESISIEHAQELTEIYQLGDVAPQELKEGTISISGTITRKYETGNFSAAAVPFNEMATAAVKIEYWVAIFPEGDAFPKVLISNCKFGNYSCGVDIDGIFVETVDFKGLAFAISEA